MDERIKPEGLMAVVTGNYEIKMTDGVSMETVRKIQAEHDAEVGELVEALRKAYMDYVWPSIVENEEESLKAKIGDLVFSYTKTPCPECGGCGEIDWGIVASPNHIPPSKTEPCPICKGSGKVWRRK